MNIYTQTTTKIEARPQSTGRVSIARVDRKNVVVEDSYLSLHISKLFAHPLRQSEFLCPFVYISFHEFFLVCFR